ncbi:TBC1 domain family member 31 isoform X1 [Carcharodon carcharias]|uniref:TBC1 domain family member 31 isoform X1 n=2 Tax=Carcharodon carcharias TaxID=13397 RepID=UPI001B7F0EBA|nr:TBC1 domain family member 31 isoform X1 [Carcharodon carcharias]
MQSSDIGARERGKIWHRRPSPLVADGVIVNVTHSVVGYHSKTIRFLHVAFDAAGEAFLAGDHQGNIYLFDLSRNSFKLVQRTGQACTALAFNLRRKTEYLVALADYSVKCFDTDTKELVSWMRGHESAVSSISVHGSGRYAITTSSDAAQLWDLDTFQRKRKLNVHLSVGIQKVYFLPLSNTIISCFRDDSIFAWESDTLHCKYQLPVPEDESRITYRAFAVTRDGQSLVAGGKSNFLHLWCLNARQLQRIIQMPPKVRTVRHLEFLPNSFDGGSSQVIGVLSQDGIMRFINVQTCKLLFDIGSLDNGINTVAISQNGHYIAAVLEDGSLNIYSVKALSQELNKPPPPLVKVVADSKKTKDSKNQNGVSGLKMRVTSGRVARPLGGKSAGKKIQTRVLKPSGSIMEDKENVLPAGLNKKRLQALLKEFGEYPEKYRMFIWRSLLQLPENHAAFSSLTDKGTHAAYLGIHERYPIKSRKLLRVLQRVLSAMAHWSAIFAEVSYLPLLAFPFVKLFQNNQLIGFEVVATIIISWCQHWFEYFPNPPINILSVVENILAHHDKELLQHLVKYNITSQLYAWPLMETLFSEVLTREEWLKLFDNVFSNHPSFLLVAVAAYLICSRTPLLQCNIKGDLEHFFHHRNNLDLSAVIKEAYHLMDTTPEDINPKRMLDDFVPLTKGQYPIFNKYPKFVVNYQTKEREKIWHEELDYLKERQLAHGLQAESVKRQAENAAWYRQQQLLQEAEEQRRKILLEEEQKLVEQRVRLAAMKRELKVKELQVLDAAHKRFLKHQQEQQKSELRRLDDEIDRKVALRSKETAALIQDIEVRNMELDMQKKIFEQQLAKDQETVMRGVKGHLDTNWIKADVEEQKFKRVLEMDQDPNVEDYKNNEEELATADQLSAAVGWQAQMLHKQRVYNLDQKKCQTQLAHLASESRERETKLLQMTKEVEGKRWDEVVGRHVQPKASQQERAAAEAQRPPLLLDEMSRAAEHDGDLHKNLFEGLCHTSTKYPTKQRRDPLQGSGEENPGSLCLNNVSLDSSVQLSLDRGRADLESKERELMTGIQELRQKLTTRARQRYSTSSLADEMIYTHY